VEKLKEKYSESLLLSSHKDKNQHQQQLIFPSTQSQLQPIPMLNPTYPHLPHSSFLAPSAPPLSDENEFAVNNRKETPSQNSQTFTSLAESEQQRYFVSLAQKQYQEELDKQLAMNLQSEEDKNVSFSCLTKHMYFSSLYSISLSLSHPFHCSIVC
jgi:hypothetical protein